LPRAAAARRRPLPRAAAARRRAPLPRAASVTAAAPGPGPAPPRHRAGADSGRAPPAAVLMPTPCSTAPEADSGPASPPLPRAAAEPSPPPLRDKVDIAPGAFIAASLRVRF
jgi:hypothetical protein